MTPDPKRWKALGVLGIAYLMVVLDISIVNVALPSIQEDLDFSTSGLQWVVSGYALTFGGFLLLGGRSGDMLGRRKVFMAGLLLFASSRCSAGSRVVGGGARRLPALPGRGRRDPLAVGLLDHARDVRGGRERNKALGVLGAIAGSGAAIGVILGGDPHGVRGLGVDLLRQRPDRAARALLRPALRAREPG